MRKTMVMMCGLCILLLAARPSVAADVERPAWEQCQTYDPETGEPHIDAICFFDVLVARYRNLSTYEDVADLREVTRRDGEQPQERSTRIGCAIEDGRLHVLTPRRALRRQLGLDAPLRRTRAMERASRERDLWLAPHMALKFATEGARDFRAGVDEGFTATEAEAITIGDRPMVHLEIQSGDGQQEEPTATFDLYVNPDSMLVERIQGQQRLPDGAECTTMLEITPLHAVTMPSALREPGNPPS